jgi:hypothetical protein
VAVLVGNVGVFVAGREGTLTIGREEASVGLREIPDLPFKINKKEEREEETEKKKERKKK